ncbi:Heavy-metal-associated domain-containing protein [Lachnospiraceae bacterium NE2001]|nr:Heavy-metal-associated domain-containing protein [Lachnospiraceae bacterium NE2001]
MKKTYKVDVDCAACAEKMQEAIKKTEGVKDATLSFMTLKCKVEFEDGVDADTVIRQARENCKKIEDEFEIFID